MCTYFDIKNPGSLGGLSGFLRNNKFSNKEAVNALLGLSEHAENSESRVRFPRTTAIATEPKSIYSADLLDVSKWKYANSHMRFILTVVCNFSKAIYLEPLKSKRAEQQANGMKEIIKRANIPNNVRLWLDNGSGWRGKFAELMKEHNIKMYHTTTTLKAVIVERYQSEIRRQFRVLFAKNKNKKYLPFLRNIEEKLNRTISTTHGMKPIDALKD